MRTKIFSLFFALSLLTSCGVNDCDYDCDTGPLSLNFALLDKESRENLFTNGTYQLDKLKVLDLDNENATISYRFITEDDLNQLVLGPFGHEIQEPNYAITINTETVFSISLKTEEISDTCCSSIILEEFNLSGAEYSQNETTGVYEVLIEI